MRNRIIVIVVLALLTGCVQHSPNYPQETIYTATAVTIK